MEQERVATALQKVFPLSEVIDRRKAPSHGYRAIHVVVTVDDKLIEVQVRTQLQHLWAELSEKYSDKIDPAIKYGGGDSEIKGFLSDAAALVARIESIESIEVSPPALSEIGTNPGLLDFFSERKQFVDLKVEIKRSFSKLISSLETTSSQDQ